MNFSINFSKIGLILPLVVSVALVSCAPPQEGSNPVVNTEPGSPPAQDDPPFRPQGLIFEANGCYERAAAKALFDDVSFSFRVEAGDQLLIRDGLSFSGSHYIIQSGSDRNFTLRFNIKFDDPDYDDVELDYELSKDRPIDEFPIEFYLPATVEWRLYKEHAYHKLVQGCFDNFRLLHVNRR